MTPAEEQQMLNSLTAISQDMKALLSLLKDLTLQQEAADQKALSQLVNIAPNGASLRRVFASLASFAVRLCVPSRAGVLGGEALAAPARRETHHLSRLFSVRR
jgi:hypothetical protein